MNKITWFKNYLIEVQAEIAGINHNRMAIDKSQVVKHLNDLSSAQNYLLLGIIPDFGSAGTNGDDYKQNASTQLWIVKKTTYSEVNYQEFYQIFEDTYQSAEDVLKKLIDDSLSGCEMLRFLNTPTIQMLPVWNEASCNGWKILFNFDLEL